LRIFYAAGASPNAYHIGESTLWKSNLFDSLVDMGHEVVPFSRDVTWHFTQYRDYQTSPREREKFLEYKSYLQKELLREIAAEHGREKLDIFFSYFWSEICDPETVEAIRALGITTVNWYCNGSYQFELVAGLAPHYDWCLVPEKFRLSDYAAVGARAIYCQEAANHRVYRPYDVPAEFDVTFVGQAYGDRPAYVSYLLEQGIDVRAFGYGWRQLAEQGEAQSSGAGARGGAARSALRVARRLSTPDGWRAAVGRLARALGRGAGAAGPPPEPPVRLPHAAAGGVLSDLEMIQMYSRSKINLGFSTCGATHLTGERIVQIRLRDFEVPMSGGFYMVEYMEELEEFFKVGEEVVCYAGPEDLADKINYYLRHDAEREAIRRAGYERCLRDHTWRKRFEKVFEEMGLNRCAASPVS
jgi:spore maturation protein CgeB